MTKEELKLYQEYDQKFRDACEKACAALTSYEHDYNYADADSCVIDDNKKYVQVKCSGYNRGWWEEFYRFPIEMLTMTDEELTTYVDDMIRERTRKELEKKAETEKMKEEAERELFQKLKKKYG